MLRDLRQLLSVKTTPVVIIECRQCGTNVSQSDEECPQCGSNEIARYEM